MLSIQSWETVENIAGVHIGAERARKDFVERGQSREKDSGVNLGSDVHWRDNDITGCALEILDENAVLTVQRGNRKVLADEKDEQCRGSVRELAKQFYAAVQPR